MGWQHPGVRRRQVCQHRPNVRRPPLGWRGDQELRVPITGSRHQGISQRGETEGGRGVSCWLRLRGEAPGPTGPPGVNDSLPPFLITVCTPAGVTGGGLRWGQVDGHVLRAWQARATVPQWCDSD